MNICPYFYLISICFLSIRNRIIITIKLFDLFAGRLGTLMVIVGVILTLVILAIVTVIMARLYQKGMNSLQDSSFKKYTHLKTSLFADIYNYCLFIY